MLPVLQYIRTETTGAVRWALRMSVRPFSRMLTRSSGRSTRRCDSVVAAGCDDGGGTCVADGAGAATAEPAKIRDTRNTAPVGRRAAICARIGASCCDVMRITLSPADSRAWAFRIAGVSYDGCEAGF